MQERYLGGKKEKRMIRRMNEKKVVFDWEMTDDTSQDVNPLYAEKHHTMAGVCGQSLLIKPVLG